MSLSAKLSAYFGHIWAKVQSYRRNALTVPWLRNLAISTPGDSRAHWAFAGRWSTGGF